MRVLFIGNSFTARNDVPALLASLAEWAGERVTHDLIWAGGASLKMHWNKGVAAERIATGAYDVVVLQEQSTLPVKNAKRFHENVRLFDAAVRASGARLALYMTWARRHAPETQRTLTEAYEAIGAELGALVVPVGVAWERVLARPDAPSLYDTDGSHPSPAGSYLAACTFLAALLGKNPTGAPVHVRGLEPDAAALLQTTAWEAARG